MPNLGPPWIIFSDKGRPVAILPAGRPGEVANIEGLSMAQARAIVQAASEGAFEQKLGSLIGAMQSSIKEISDSVLLGSALELLEAHEWDFEDRGGTGEWNVCPSCYAEHPISTRDFVHKPDCHWASVVKQLREALTR